MNCDEAKLLLWADRDGELTAEGRDLLARHQRACAPCRQAAADLHRLARAFATARGARVPPDLETRLLAHVQASAAMAPRIPMLWRRAAAVLAGVGLWLALSLAWRNLVLSRSRPPVELADSNVARHLAHTLPLLDARTLPGVRDPLFEATPELRLLAALRARKGG